MDDSTFKGSRAPMPRSNYIVLILLPLMVFLQWSAPVVNGQDVDSKKPFSAPDFPNLSKDFEACGTTRPSYICDPSHSLGHYDIDSLNKLIRSLHDISLCLCENRYACNGSPKHAVNVAIVPRCKYSNGTFPRTGDEEQEIVRQFADYLRIKGWSSSDGYCPARIYIVYDKYTQRIWASLNSFASIVISNAMNKQILLNTELNYIYSRNIYGAIKFMVEEYRESLVVYEQNRGIPVGLGLIIAIGCIMAVIIIFLLYCIICHRRCKENPRFCLDASDKCGCLGKTFQFFRGDNMGFAAV